MNIYTHRPYELLEYDPKWKERFFNVTEKLKPILGDNLVGVEHIGSTSIEGMVAKPQIDVLAVVKNLDAVKDCYNAFAQAGFTPRGRGYVNDADEYVTEDSLDGRRLTSVHILQVGNPKIVEYKVTRDYLRENAEDRNLYIATKRNLHAAYRDDYQGYVSGKNDVINAIKDRAMKWAAV